MTPQQTAASEATKFVTKFNDIILFPTIGLLSGIAFLVFLWGCAQYFINADNDQARQEGVKHITFGIIGLVIMMSAMAILVIAVRTFGLGQQLQCADDPTLPACEDAFTLPSNNDEGSNTPPGSDDEGSNTPPG